MQSSWVREINFIRVGKFFISNPRCWKYSWQHSPVRGSWGGRNLWIPRQPCLCPWRHEPRLRSRRKGTTTDVLRVMHFENWNWLQNGKIYVQKWQKNLQTFRVRARLYCFLVSYSDVNWRSCIETMDLKFDRREYIICLTCIRWSGTILDFSHAFDSQLVF